LPKQRKPEYANTIMGTILKLFTYPRIGLGNEDARKNTEQTCLSQKPSRRWSYDNGLGAGPSASLQSRTCSLKRWLMKLNTSNRRTSERGQSISEMKQAAVNGRT